MEDTQSLESLSRQSRVFTWTENSANACGNGILFFLKDGTLMRIFWLLPDFQATAKDNAVVHIVLYTIVCTDAF